MKKKKVRTKKFNAAVHNQKRIQSNLNKIWFIGGTCLNEVKVGGKCTPTDVSILLARKQVWSAAYLVFGIDEETGERTVRLDARAYPTPIDKEELHEDLIPQMEEHLHRMEMYGGIDVISTGYFIVPSLDVDLDASMEMITERFEHYGAFDRTHCAIQAEFKQTALANKQLNS